MQAQSSDIVDSLIARIGGLPPEKLQEVVQNVAELKKRMKFIPSPGPQYQAYISKADILLYGGEPGGGKSGLLIGLALNEHDRSLLVRKQFTDVQGLVDNARDIVGSADGFVGGTRPKYTRENGGVIHFQGLADSDMDTSKQGTPHDFIGVDEAAQLPRNAVMMLLGWNRTNKPGQRCRMVLASNPPLDSTGDWLGGEFAPWLDPAYANPAAPGELRWFIVDADGKSREVDGPDNVVIDGRTFYPHSRTYIPAGLKDNPFIDEAEYRKKLDSMPEPYRSMLVSGNFLAARKDQDFQCIPSDWIRQAQARWTPVPPADVPMCAISCDPAGGGDDDNIISQRHDGWFAPLICIPGKETPHGTQVGGHIIVHRRDNADVIVDMGGGYGGAAYTTLTSNGIEVKSHKGSEKSMARTVDKKLGFVNKRSEVYWKFREALDPSQPGGSPIALPPDPVLVSDLTAPTFKVTPNGIQIEPKDEVKKKLKRSPDRGDAVVNGWSIGNTIANIAGGWTERAKSQRNLTVNIGHADKKRKH